MDLTRQEVIALAARPGISGGVWQLADLQFATVSDDYAGAVWAAWVDSLRLNAPELLTTLDLGGGRSRLVPRWVAEAGDCDDHSLLCVAHAITGNWISAVRGGPKVARTYGLLFFTAQSRAENRFRAGAHSIVWYINHEGLFRTFEPGDGERIDLLPAEYASVSFGFAA